MIVVDLAFRGNMTDAEARAFDAEGKEQKFTASEITGALAISKLMDRLRKGGFAGMPFVCQANGMSGTVPDTPLRKKPRKRQKPALLWGRP